MDSSYAESKIDVGKQKEAFFIHCSLHVLSCSSFPSTIISRSLSHLQLQQPAVFQLSSWLHIDANSCILFSSFKAVGLCLQRKKGRYSYPFLNIVILIIDLDADFWFEWEINQEMIAYFHTRFVQIHLVLQPTVWLLLNLLAGKFQLHFWKELRKTSAEDMVEGRLQLLLPRA